MQNPANYIQVRSMVNQRQAEVRRTYVEANRRVGRPAQNIVAQVAQAVGALVVGKTAAGN